MRWWNINKNYRGDEERRVYGSKPRKGLAKKNSLSLKKARAGGDRGQIIRK